MEQFFLFLEEFLLFLEKWPQYLAYIALASLIWGSIVLHLFYTGHAKLGKKGQSDDFGCGDIRVDRLFVIFGGPSGLTFGLPYFWVMNFLGLEGILRDYWSGFIYLQFLTSVLQSVLFLYLALFGKKPQKGWRLFKSHLKGCGWVSGLSPVGWILYWIQQLLPNQIKWVVWIFRDIETFVLFFTNAPQAIGICLLGSTSGTITIPFITWIDHDHSEDEDSSNTTKWSGPSMYTKQD